METQISTENSQITLSRVTRKNVIDLMKIRRIYWGGGLDQVDFLSRLYDLTELPSHDSRFSNASGDIWQHVINNDDWEPDWVFTDSRFNLMNGPDEDFLTFICEMIHPVVRSNPEETQELCNLFNDCLKIDGWELYPKDYLGGRIIYGARPLHGRLSLEHIRETTAKLEAGYIHRQIKRMESSVETDPDLAIGTAKDLVESCCKTILYERGVQPEGKLELTNLIKATLKELQLLPDDIDASAKGADIIKKLLSNLGTVAQGLAELRNLYGTGHGKAGHHKGLQPRHAKLAAGAASTLSLFLLDTHQEREK
jgi:hypothetical protein